MKRPHIQCPQCKGSGAVLLGEAHFVVLLVVKEWGEAMASAIHHRLGENVQISAINNRLEDLRKLGLLNRKRDGKRWIYSPAKKSALIGAKGK